VRLLCCILALVLQVAFVRPAWAQPSEGPRLVLVADASTSRVAARIREELATMGFDPVLEVREVSSVDELPAITRDGQAAATARLEVFETGVRVWVFDRATGKTLTRELSPDNHGGDASLALHVVELLRASLLELKLPDSPRGDLAPTPALLEATGVPPTAEAPSPPPSASAPAPSAAPTQPVEAAPTPLVPPGHPIPLLALELGAALVAGKGDLEQHLALLAAVQIFVSSDFRLGPVGWIPLSSADHVAETGSSKNRITLFGVEARWQPGSGLWRPFVCLGLGAAYLETQGAADSAEFEGEANSAITPGALLRAGFGLRLSRGLRLSPQANLGLQARYFSVDYAASASARWGPWWGSASLTLEADFVE